MGVPVGGVGSSTQLNTPDSTTRTHASTINAFTNQ